MRARLLLAALAAAATFAAGDSVAQTQAPAPPATAPSPVQPAASAATARFAADVTEEAVSVTSNYQGARLIVFGAHWGQPRGRDIVVALRGPAETVTVRRKRRVLGLWINADPVEFQNVPSFFALASTRSIEKFLDPATISQLGLDPGALSRLKSFTPADSDPAAYRRGLVRLKRRAGLYRESPQGVEISRSGAFKAPFIIPANAPVGVYHADVYLFRNGALVSVEPSEITVSRIGLEKAVWTAAHEHKALYGFCTVLFAAAFGWAASLVFRRR